MSKPIIIDRKYGSKNELYYGEDITKGIFHYIFYLAAAGFLFFVAYYFMHNALQLKYVNQYKTSVNVSGDIQSFPFNNGLSVIDFVPTDDGRRFVIRSYDNPETYAFLHANMKNGGKYSCTVEPIEENKIRIVECDVEINKSLATYSTN